MVHALQEAHRVLRPNGWLVDLRPAAVHRRVGIQFGRRWTLAATMNEDLADDHRANRAIRTALAERLFRGEAYRRFDVTRHAGRLPLFKIYLEEFSTLARLPPYEGMVHKVAVALARQPASATIVIRGPLDLRVLRKRG